MEVTDAYQEYVQTRREENPLDKIVSLSLTAEDMGAIYVVIDDTVAAAKGLSGAGKKRWEYILNSIAKAIDEVE